MVKHRTFTKTLAIIGGIFIIIESIIGIVSYFSPIQNFFPFSEKLEAWFVQLIAAFIGFIVLLACGVFSKNKDVPYNGWLLLILGILGLILTNYHVGGALVIIASILWIIGKK